MEPLYLQIKPVSIFRTRHLMKKLLVLLVLLFSIGVYAQKGKDTEPRNESFITTDVISPFYYQGTLKGFSDNGTPRWRLGYIKNINPKTKIGIDIGYGNANSSIIQTFDNYSLWEIRPEYYHILNPKRKTLSYFSLALFYLNQHEEFKNQYFFSKDNGYSTFDKADYKRQKFGLIPKFGMFVNISNRIGLNWYTGVGVNYRINSYSDFVNLRPKQYNEEHFSPYFRREGNRIGVEFTIGLKIYYRIKN